MFDDFANARGWADSDRVLLLQSSLKGKALREFSALKRADANVTSAMVREVVLRAYEQTPETYRERFRLSRKKEGQTYLELLVS